MQITGTGIKLRQLQVFREVIRTGSERLAARLLNVTQPAVSQNIKQLEDAVGFPLFLRQKGKMLPTDQGWELLRSIDSAFAGLDRLRRNIDGIRSRDRRTLVIGAPSAFSLRLLPQIAKVLRHERLFDRFHVRSGHYQEVANQVHEGRSDIALSRLPIDERLFDYLPVAKATNVCLFATGHRFADLQTVTPEHLVGEPLIDIDPQYSSHQMNVNALRFLGEDPDIAVEYDDHGHDAGFVSAGIGVSITNSIIAKEYQHFSLDSRIFEPGAAYHYVILWQKGRALDASTKRVIEIAADALVN